MKEIDYTWDERSLEKVDELYVVYVDALKKVKK